MRKIKSDYELLQEYIPSEGGVVVDVGCGTGELVRWMAMQGVTAFGLDVEDMITKAEAFATTKDEKYMVGLGQELPFDNEFANMITYIASFHHVPYSEMHQALRECHRVLKPGGKAFFIEPVAAPNSYYEIIRLVEDEASIQDQAYQVIKGAETIGLKLEYEELFYNERTFQDYLNLLTVFVESDTEKEQIIEKAKSKTKEICGLKGIHFNDFLYQSIANLIVLQKVE